MKFKAKDWDFICTKCNDEGLYDLMIYNPTRKELFLEKNVDKERINGVDSFGNPYFSAEISRKAFDIIFEGLFDDGGCEEGFFYDWKREKIYRRSKKTEIPKETIFKAIRGELSEQELYKIVQRDPEYADYYDFEAFMSMIHRFLNGEVSRQYYLDWTIVVSWALINNPFKENSKKSLLYEHMSYCFDGHSFDDLQDEKEVECRSMIAFLKHYNHSLINIRKAKEPPFYNDGKVIAYICFDFCNHYNSYYKLCIADEKNNAFTMARICNPDYLENVNYTFIDSRKFDRLSNTYYEFYLDSTMDISKYIVQRPYLDVDGNPRQ